MVVVVSNSIKLFPLSKWTIAPRGLGVRVFPSFSETERKWVIVLPINSFKIQVAQEFEFTKSLGLVVSNLESSCVFHWCLTPTQSQSSMNFSGGLIASTHPTSYNQLDFLSFLGNFKSDHTPVMDQSSSMLQSFKKTLTQRFFSHWMNKIHQFSCPHQQCKVFLYLEKVISMFYNSYIYEYIQDI